MAITCPICERAMPGQKSEWPDHPFCSPRCRKIDLGRWLSEEYRLGGAPSDQEDESTPSSGDTGD